MNSKRKEKFGDLLLGIAKYIITAVILTSFFQGMGTWSWYTYIISIAVVTAVIFLGLILFDEDKNIKKKG